LNFILALIVFSYSRVNYEEGMGNKNVKRSEKKEKKFFYGKRCPNFKVFRVKPKN